MASSAERAWLCLALSAYAGTHGAAARHDLALHDIISSWLNALAPIRGHRIIWGPASFRMWWQPSAPALVVFVTATEGDDTCHVVVRGGGPLSVWDASVESLAFLGQEPWLWARASGSLAPAVCSGVLQQLEIVRELAPEEQLPGAGRCLIEFLAGRVGELDGGSKLPVWVGGHGLGGSLATAIALWLRDTQGSVSSRDLDWDPRQRAKLHCTAFACPTVGNGDFVGYAAERLGTRLNVVHNGLDHVALLWDTQLLASMAELYQPHVSDCALVSALAAALADEIERRGVEYEQPQARILDGRLNTMLPTSFTAQAEYQHLHAYVDLLGLSDLVDLDAIFDRPSGTDDGPMAQ